jgi:hypothetical protein
MPIPLIPPALEIVLQGLHESEIRCGIPNEPPAGGITTWIDFGSRTEKATFYGTTVGDRQVWPAADRIAAWLHETALRLFPESPGKRCLDKVNCPDADEGRANGRPKRSSPPRLRLGPHRRRLSYLPPSATPGTVRAQYQ